MKYSIGIDLGGTNIKVVAVSETGQTLVQRATETGLDAQRQWAENVRSQIESVEGELNSRATAVGLASPGIVAANGRSMASVTGHLENIAGFDWSDYLKPHCPALLNDAHAALLGEAAQGAAQNARNAVLITLGTGVGGGILSQGRLLRGHLGRGGHLGHMCLDVDGVRDSNGIPGTLESAIGNQSVSTRSEGLFSSTEALVKAYLAGDENARRIWLRSIYQLACAVTSLINIVDPEVVIIGGGIAQAGDALFTPLSECLEKMEWRALGFQVPVVPALLGNFSGAIGAAFNALDAAARATVQRTVQR